MDFDVYNNIIFFILLYTYWVSMVTLMGTFKGIYIYIYELLPYV